MQHIVHTLRCLHAGIQVLNVALKEGVIRMIEEHFNILALAGREIVETTHTVAEI